jgi:hypothetical protein
MKVRIYVETTVPSYLAAWPSRDLIRAAHQQITREWWAKRGAFELYTSRLVVQECQAGDLEAAADRLAVLAEIPLLEQTPDVADLAEALVQRVPLPAKAAADALHIAVAAVNGMDYLLTWNCTHIANVTLRSRIEAVCRAAGYEPPLICTPEELPVEESDDA